MLGADGLESDFRDQVEGPVADRRVGRRDVEGQPRSGLGHLAALPLARLRSARPVVSCLGLALGLVLPAKPRRRIVAVGTREAAADRPKGGAGDLAAALADFEDVGQIVGAGGCRLVGDGMAAARRHRRLVDGTEHPAMALDRLRGREPRFDSRLARIFRADHPVRIFLDGDPEAGPPDRNVQIGLGEAVSGRVKMMLFLRQPIRLPARGAPDTRLAGRGYRAGPMGFRRPRRLPPDSAGPCCVHLARLSRRAANIPANGGWRARAGRRRSRHGRAVRPVDLVHGILPHSGGRRPSRGARANRSRLHRTRAAALVGRLCRASPI